MLLGDMTLVKRIKLLPQRCTEEKTNKMLNLFLCEALGLLFSVVISFYLLAGSW
jgi:hypothetical protein